MLEFIQDFFAYMRESKKFWIAPIVIILVVFGALVLTQGTAVAPFIYTLF